jgi:serine/threonine protein kinase
MTPILITGPDGTQVSTLRFLTGGGTVNCIFDFSEIKGYVLKCPKPDPKHDPIPRYDWEAAVYERLGPHPGIVKYIGRSSEGGLWLEDAEQRSIPYFWSYYHISPVQVRFKWCIQVAEALAHIHDKGFIYGDLQPGNVVITQDLNAKLCDFEGTVEEGSPSYIRGMPPFYRIRELLEDFGCYLSRQDDIFAFGQLVLSVFQARYPYASLSYKERMILYSDPSGPILPPIPDIVDPRLRTVIANCWSDSYKDAHELLAALRDIEADLLNVPLLGYDSVCLSNFAIASTN